jgi:hypothetical protein
MAIVKSPRRAIEVFSMSFLDMISCAFGAIILLLVMSMALEPATLEHMTAELEGTVDTIKDSRDQLVAKAKSLQRELADKQQVLAEVQEALNQLEAELVTAEGRDAQIQAKADAQLQVKKELESVLQKLTTEMKSLLSDPTYQPPGKDALIGGIPMDSEYIIFVIDTSGSMLIAAWPLVIKKIDQVLNVYPEVKGIQVVNDMGHYMFQEYAGRWIPDTPARRKEVIRRLRTWKSFSNSSPVEGIRHVVRTYARSDKNISLYVFGDDFASGSIDAVAREVIRINRRDASGTPRVRIHCFGFPVLFLASARGVGNITRFAHLMRVLAEQNAGSFVGLTDLR